MYARLGNAGEKSSRSFGGCRGESKERGMLLYFQIPRLLNNLAFYLHGYNRKSLEAECRWNRSMRKCGGRFWGVLRFFSGEQRANNDTSFFFNVLKVNNFILRSRKRLTLYGLCYFDSFNLTYKYSGINSNNNLKTIIVHKNSIITYLKHYIN